MVDNIEGINESYLSSIADLPADTGSEQNAQTGDQDEQPPANEQSGSEVVTTEGETQRQNAQDQRTQQQSTARGGEQQQQTQQTGQTPRLRRHASGQFVDDEGNITNEKGEIIAPRGPARRLHEQNVRMQRDMQTMQQEMQQLRYAAQSNALLNGIPQRYGLTNEEVAQSLDWAGRIKRGDALGVARDVVAMLAAKGHNISELVGANVGDAIDMRAIRAMLDERLAPIDQQQREQQVVTEQENRARAAYNEFVRVNEYADVQGDVIVAMMRRQGINQQQAYNAVREFVVKNGLDMSQPLGPQIEAIQQRVQQRQQMQQQNTQQQQNTRPMPNGATRSDGVQQMTPVFADPDDTWADILHQAMNEQGM